MNKMAYNGHGAYSSGASSSSSSASSSTVGSGSKRVRTVSLIRRPGIRLGFSLRGGKEHGTGFFVTSVEPNTEASQQGLLAGDQILRVNGFPVDDATHKEVLQLILGQNTVSLKVKSVGMIPVKETAEDELSWQIVDPNPNSTPPPSNVETNHHHLDVCKPDPNDDPPGFTNRQIMNDVKMVLKVPPRAKLGCGICKGPEWKPGVFIQFTKENSIARIAGLRPGDQILQCNNFPFTPETPFNEAVSVMRCSGVLELIVRKGAGLDLFPGESSGYNSSASSVAGDNPPRLSNINEDNITHHQQPISDPLQYNGNHTSQSERVNGEHSPNDNGGRTRGYPGGSTVIHVGGDETDNHKIAEIRMVSQQLETKTTTVFVEVHHSEEDNVSRTQSEASTDRLTNSSSVSSFTSSASSLSSAISQELERRSKRASLDTSNKNSSQTDKLIKSGLAKEKVEQHAQLMLEFKKAHKRMFASDGEGNGTNNLPSSSEEREESRLKNEKSPNGSNESSEQCKKFETANKSNDHQDRTKTKRQSAPPPPPPLPSSIAVKEDKPIQKTTHSSQPTNKKQPAPPPPPPPSPPYCPTPDYDTASLASQITSDDNNKNGGESDTVKRRGAGTALKGGKVQQKSDIVEMQSLESFKLTNPAKIKPKPPNTYFTQNSSSNQSDTSNGTSSTIPIKESVSKPIVTIREYPGGRERKNPSKFDFLQNIPSCQNVGDDKQPIASRLQNELCQTLQRAATLTKNEAEVGTKLQNGQITKNGGTVVTINISSQQQNSSKPDLIGKQPFYLFPHGKANGIENKKINDLMLQSTANINNNNNNKSHLANGKAKSSLDNATKNSVTFNFSNKTQETRTVNMVQPNGILKNGNNISHVQIQSQIPQQKSIKFGGM